MSTLIVFGIPFAVLGVVLLLGFVGCGLDAGGLATSTPFDDAVFSVDSLVAFWHLDEEGGTTAHDSQNGHDGTYGSAPLAEDAALQSAAAPGTLDFDQPSLIASEPSGRSINVDGGWVEVPHSDDLNAAKFTVQAFVRTAWTEDDTGFFRCVFSNQNGDGTTGLGLYANPDNRWEAWIGDGKTAVFTTSDIPIGFGTIEYLVVAYNGATLKLYVDGALHASLDAGYAPTTTETETIGISVNRSWPFAGQIDEVAYYNVDLDQATISNIGLMATSGE